jgi:hypothetical protein
MILPRRTVLLLVALAGSACDAGESAQPKPTPSAAPRVPQHYQITAKNHRGVLHLEVGDTFELPDGSDYSYSADLKDPSIFRADSPSHFTAVKSGASQLLVSGEPRCGAGTPGCGLSRLRWTVQLFVE